MTPVIQLQSVSVSIQGKSILQDITLEIQPGGIFTLLGPNGAGKSTLMRSILGMIPYDGTIHIHENNATRLSSLERARSLAYMPQLISTSSNFRVDEFVRMGDFPWRGLESEDECTRRVDEAIHLCQLDTFRHRAIQSLSGGERQRALLAQVMVQNTPILLLDEPTVFLDIHHQALFEDIMISLRDQGRTIVYISHDIFSAKRISTHVGAMKEGQLVARGAPADVLTLPRLSELFDMPLSTVEQWFSQSIVSGE